MHRVTGHVERALLATDEPGSVPERVTAALALFLGGGAQAHAEARSASVGQRRQLVREVLAEVDGAVSWRTCVCAGCGEPFDVEVDLEALPPPRTAGGDSMEVVLSSGTARVRRLTGADEEAAVAGDDADTVAARLADLAVIDDVVLTDADRSVVADALTRLGPDVVTTLAAECPACGEPVVVDIDPLHVVGRGDDGLFEDTHRLATAYGWSVDEVLALPVRRRRRHVRRIDAERGVRS